MQNLNTDIIPFQNKNTFYTLFLVNKEQSIVYTYIVKSLDIIIQTKVQDCKNEQEADDQPYGSLF